MKSWFYSVNKKEEINTKNNKTLWQKIYSFFGFWTYIECKDYSHKKKVVYWCCLPWIHYFRKFDLFHYMIKD